MDTIVLYSRPMAWFTPRQITRQAFTEFSFFEPVDSFNNLVLETLNESPTGYSLEYAMPALRKKDVSIKVDNGILKIKAISNSDSSKWFNRNKSSYQNHFAKEIGLSDDMDEYNIKAKFKNGQLLIDIPKKREYVNQREIPVKGSSEFSEVKAMNESTNRSLFANIKQRIERIFKKAA